MKKINYIFNSSLYPIKNFLNRFLTALKWFIFIFKNNYYNDDTALILTIKYFLKEKIKDFEKNATFITAKSHIRIMRLIVVYLDKFCEDVSKSRAFKLFENKYGKIEAEFIPINNSDNYTVKLYFTKCDTNEKNNYASKIYYRLIKRYEFYRDKYKQRAFDLLKKYCNYWWY